MAEFEAPGIEEWYFTMVWIFAKLIKMCMENVVREQVQQHFPWESSKLSANSSCHVNLLFIGRSLKRGNFAIFDKLFRFRFFFL